MDDHEKQFDGLRVGQPSMSSRVRERWTAMGKVKKGSIAALAFFALIHFIGGTAHHASKWMHHGKHGHHRGPRPMVWEDDFENWTPSESRWSVDMDNAILGTVSADTDHGEFHVTNTTFDSSAIISSKHHRHHKTLALDISEGVEARLLVSKADVDHPTFVVESLWSDEMSLPVLVTSKHQDTLLIESSNAVHDIHLVLPQDANSVPRLHIRSPSKFPINLHSSVRGEEEVFFRHVEMVTESDIIMEDEILAQDVRLYTSNGTITGSYNVSKALILMTDTKDINVNVTIFLEGHTGPGGDHSHPPHHPHHERPGPKDDEEHGPRRHEYRGNGHKGRGCGKGSFLARLFGIKRGPEHHPHRRPHHPPPHPPPPPPPHPPAPYIGLTSVKGDITLNVEPHRYPSPSDVVVKTVTTNGDIFVHISEMFHGFFKAVTVEGDLDVGTTEEKTVEVVKKIEDDDGSLIEGFIHFTDRPEPPKHKHGKHGHKGKKHKKDKKEKRDDDESDDDEDDEERWEDEDDEEAPFPPPEDDSDWPFPPHKGPGGRPPPPPPPPPPHKGPGGPPPPPHKEPGGPPPPPHKGPGGPPPPHGPHGPHGPPPPKPPGSVITAETHDGDIKLEL